MAVELGALALRITADGAAAMRTLDAVDRKAKATGTTFERLSKTDAGSGAIGRRIALRSDGVRMDGTAAASAARLRDIQGQLGAALSSTSLTLDQRIRLNRHLATTQAALAGNTGGLTGAMG